MEVEISTCMSLVLLWPFGSYVATSLVLLTYFANITVNARATAKKQ